VIDHENPFYGHSHCTSAQACIEVSVPCKSEGKLVLTACPGTMQSLAYAVVNSMWLTAVVRSENYKHHHINKKFPLGHVT
jgi:hypothetical protein